MSERLAEQRQDGDALRHPESLGGGMGMFAFILIYSALVGGIGYVAWRQVNRRYLRWTLLAIVLGTVLVDYVRCSLNRNLYSSGQFYGDLMLIEFAVLLAGTIWCVVKWTRRRLSNDPRP